MNKCNCGCHPALEGCSPCCFSKAHDNTNIYDNVNHPAHYNLSTSHCECGRRIECIDVTRNMNFNVGNAVKYLWRFEHKNGVEDLRKVRWYLDDQIKKMEAAQEKNRDVIFGLSTELI